VAIAYVRDTGRFTGSGVATASASFGTLPAVGNHVSGHTAVWHATRPTSVTFSDNQSNTWATDAFEPDPGSPGSVAATGTAKVVTSSGTFTVTVATNQAANNFIEAVAVEFSGLTTSSWLDQSSVGNWSASTSKTVTDAGANTQASELVLFTAAHNSNATNVGINPPTGYTQLAVNQDSNATIGFIAAYKIVSSIETSSASWTWTDSSGGAAVLSTYKAAAGGGGGAVEQSHLLLLGCT
jgi:hypothetical protein